jgi:hypothetical protein
LRRAPSPLLLRRLLLARLRLLWGWLLLLPRLL